MSPYDDPGHDAYQEPDMADLEHLTFLRAEAEHFDKKHPNGVCNCKTRLRNRLRDARNRAAWVIRQMHTIRIGPVELTVRYRPPAKCGACEGRGWFYTRSSAEQFPAGYNGASLCGCGSAVAALARSRRNLRASMKEAPF